MVQKYRDLFNQLFTAEKYEAFKNDIAADFDYMPTFRMAESPFFISKELKQQLIDGCRDVIDLIKRDDFLQRTDRALSSTQKYPMKTRTPLFWQSILVFAKKTEKSFPN
jgi:hypothetical protein